MVTVDYHPQFKKIYKKLDGTIKRKVEKQMIKIINNPNIGKPMMEIEKVLVKYMLNHFVYPILIILKIT